MAVPSSSPSKSKKRPASGDNGGQSQPKRTKSPGVRLVGGRIYDSENGKTCHQCRQKTMDFVASCKNRKGNKLCTLHVCHKCLLNRYGEKAEEMAVLDDWVCPKCRGICNCSFCMKKKGHKPTGILIHVAKATGLNSASELIQVKGPDNLEAFKIVASPKKLVSPKKAIALDKEVKVVSPRKLGKENSFDASNEGNLNPTDSTSVSKDKKSKRVKREGLKEISNGHKDGDEGPKRSPKRPKVSDNKSEKEEKSSPKRPKVLDNKFEIEVKANRKDGNVLVGKKKSKKTVLDKVLPNPTKPDNEKKKKDAGKSQDVVVKKDSKDENGQAKIKVSEKPQGIKRCATNLEPEKIEVDIPLPKGSALTTVWGIEFSPEDIGNALQFLEFCAAFGKVLDVKKTQGESVLRELRRGSSGRRGQYSSAVRFHIQLLSLIQEDMGEKPLSLSRKNSWLQAFEKCISESEWVPEGLSSASFGRSVEEYDGLDFSRKLMLLNFLCDEVLRTAKLRNWIEDENSKVAEKEKASKEKIAAARNKERLLKLKMQDDMAKAIMAKNGAPLTISEHESIVLQIKNDVAQAQDEILREKGFAAKRKHISDAVRSEPNFLDVDGRAFWKLRCCGEKEMLLQDMGTWDANAVTEKWFIYLPEHKQEIDKYISSIRQKRARIRNFSPAITCGGNIENA